MEKFRINMKNGIKFLLLFMMIGFLPTTTFAAGGIFPSNGGSHTVGETFSVTVKASGATFNALQGTISVSGATVVSVAAGGATWVKQPSNGGQFVGMLTSPASSLTVATVRLKGTAVGTGSVRVSGVSLANNGSIVGTSGGSGSFTITRALVMPGAVTVTSSTHPNQETQYDGTTVTLNWDKASGVTGFSYLFDQVADTNPAENVTSADTTVSYPDQKIGTYYFHIKAKNGDGWGPATHFKVQIKEPDAKIKDGLAKPGNISVSKASNFKNNIKDGTVSGIVIKGKMPTKLAMEKAITDSKSQETATAISIESSTKELYQANISLVPEQEIPEGKKLAATPTNDGSFKLTIDWPIHAGAYKLVVQGQRDKLLTPTSDVIRFEIQQEDGGAIIMLSDKDTKKYVPTFWEEYKAEIIFASLGFGSALIIFGLVYLIIWLIRKPKRNVPKVSSKVSSSENLKNIEEKLSGKPIEPFKPKRQEKPQKPEKVDFKWD